MADTRKILADHRYGDRIVRAAGDDTKQHADDVEYLQKAAPAGDLNSMKECGIIEGDWTPKEKPAAATQAPAEAKAPKSLTAAAQ